MNRSDDSRSRERASGQRGDAASGDAIVPLSDAQHRLWTLHQVEPGSRHNVAAAALLRGDLDLRCFLGAVEVVARRHDLLRTRIVPVDERPAQLVTLGAVREIQVIDVGELSAPSRRPEAERRARMAARHPFDLARGPLWRAVLIALDPREHLVLLGAHRIIADSRSIHLVLAEILRVHGGLTRGKPASGDRPRQYSVPHLVAGGPRGATPSVPPRAIQQQDPSFLRLLADHRPPGHASLRGGRQPLALPCELMRAIAAIAEREAVGVDSCLLALFAILLHRYTGEEELAIATRSGPTADEADLIGPLARDIVLRVALSGEHDGIECLRRVADQSAEARRDGVLYEDVAEALGMPAVPEVLFVFEERCRFGGPGITAEPVELDLGAAAAALSLVVVADGRPGPGSGVPHIHGYLDYDCDLFEPDTIARMADHLVRLATSFAADPARAISALPITGEEEERALRTWAHGAVDASVPDRPVHALIEEQVDRAPGAAGLVWEGGSWSYDELDRRSSQLARFLVKRGVGPESLVCLHVDRSPEMIVGLLGILKAGAGYVPLDAGYPRERLQFVLGHTGARLVVTQAALLPGVSDRGLEAVCLDADWPAIAAESGERLEMPVSPRQLAYVIYTSGSTGAPKGVMVEHRSLVHYAAAAAAAYGVGPTDRVLQFSSISFDASVEEIFVSLTRGAALVLQRPGMLESIPRTLAYWAAQGITVVSLPTAYWHELVGALARKEAALPECLRVVIIGGERAEAGAFAAWRSCVPERVRLFNTYGPTEATVVATVWDAACAPAHGSVEAVPIGRPLANMSAWVLDPQGSPSPVGVPGELYLGGPGVARGYFGEPALTAARFVTDPFSDEPGARLYRTGDRCRVLPGGDLDYVGRSDDQLKLLGHRIELGEIEARLKEHPSVKAAVVVAQVDAQGQMRLTAYVSGHAGSRPSMDELRAHLRRWLLPNLIPGFVVLDELPLTISNKIDRRALPGAGGPPAASATPTGDAPERPVEQLVHGLFCEVLHRQSAGIQDDFFELGGNSLAGVELVSLLNARLDVNVPARALFENPTIESFARAVLAHVQGDGPPGEPGLEELAAEARLDPSIRASSPRAVAVAVAEREPDAVLLTGATGFFGMFMLAELLAATGSAVRCLVRGASVDEARRRLAASWAKYCPDREIPVDRVLVVPGNLAQPLLGLGESGFRELARSIEAIYHAGASVNYMSPYRALRAENVRGTEEVLRLATRERLMPVHHVSSLSVFGSADRGAREATPLDTARDVVDGYSRSKWVAEQLIATARERGVPVAVYRPGRLTGHALTGISNPADMLVHCLQACVRVGAAPDLDIPVDMVPVDFASAALVELSRRPASLGKVFHLGHPRPIPWTDLVDALCAFGYPLRRLPYDSWRQALHQYAVHHHGGGALLAVAALGFEELCGALAGRYDCRATLDALIGSRVAVPAIDEGHLAAGFAYLVRCGQLPPPQRR
jgi:myxalamid-type nonribosomal peptide synthetase MxaA